MRIASFLITLVLLAGCYPVSMDVGERPRPVALKDGASPRPFGYFSVGPIVHAQFFDDVKGLSAGQGFSMSLPPFWPVGFLASFTVAVGAAAPFLIIEGALGLDESVIGGEIFEGVFDSVSEDLLSPQSLSHGYRVTDNKYISEYSLDLTYSYTHHQDRLNPGGSLSYQSILFGAKLAAPIVGIMWRRPRPYVRGGAGIHYFNYTARADAAVLGLYGAIGMEMLTIQTFMVGLEFMSHFYFGDDAEGKVVDGGIAQMALNMSFYF